MNPPLVKGLAAMFVMAFASLTAGFEDKIVDIAIMVVGMISIAAVMRSDVKELKSWRIEHEKQVDLYKAARTQADLQTSTAMTSLTVLMGEAQRRLQHLEDDRQQRRT